MSPVENVVQVQTIGVHFGVVHKVVNEGHQVKVVSRFGCDHLKNGLLNEQNETRPYLGKKFTSNYNVFVPIQLSLFRNPLIAINRTLFSMFVYVRTHFTTDTCSCLISDYDN